jgi:hypothetical protein
MGAGRKYPKCPRIYLPNLSAQAQKFWISIKKKASLGVCSPRKDIQQGLEKRGFWFQKKAVQLKTALLEVYTYVLKWTSFQKTV